MDRSEFLSRLGSDIGFIICHPLRTGSHFSDKKSMVIILLPGIQFEVLFLPTGYGCGSWQEGGLYSIAVKPNPIVRYRKKKNFVD